MPDPPRREDVWDLGERGPTLTNLPLGHADHDWPLSIIGRRCKIAADCRSFPRLILCAAFSNLSIHILYPGLCPFADPHLNSNARRHRLRQLRGPTVPGYLLRAISVQLSIAVLVLLKLISDHSTLTVGFWLYFIRTYHRLLVGIDIPSISHNPQQPNSIGAAVPLQVHVAGG